MHNQGLFTMRHTSPRAHNKAHLRTYRPLLILFLLFVAFQPTGRAQLIAIDSTTVQRVGKTIKVYHYYACEPFMMAGAMRRENFYHNFTQGNTEYTYYVTYTPTATSTETKSECDSYTWKYTAGRSETYNTVGTNEYTKTVQNAVCAPMLQSGTSMSDFSYGASYCKCDSIKKLNLTIRKSSSSTESKTACDSYYWPANNRTYTNSTTDTATLRNKVNCDSSVTLNLVINYSSNVEVTETHCDRYTWNGTTYTSSANPSYPAQNRYECDSITTLHLTINYSKHIDLYKDTCDTYTWNGNQYSASYAPQVSGQTSKGCDSTTTLHLTIRRSTTSRVHETDVQRNLPHRYHGYEFYNSVSNQTIILSGENAAGCDSIVTYSLTIYPTVRTWVDSTVCKEKLDAGFTWNGRSFRQPGSDSVTLRDIHNSDSIVHMNVYAYSNFYKTDRDEICDGDSYPYKSRSYTRAGTYQVNYRTTHNCDSNYTLVLAVNPVKTTNLTETVCKNHPRYFCDTYRDASGAYTCLLHTSKGCDSTVKLTLTVNDTSTSTVYDTTTENTVNQYNGYNYYDQRYTGADFANTNDLVRIARAVNANSKRCDSVITHHLHLLRNVTETIDSNVCATTLSSGFRWNGETFYSAGTKTLHRYTNYGTDSMVVMRVFSIENPVGYRYDTIVENMLPYTYRGRQFSGSVTNSRFQFANSAGGCDSIEYYNLYVKQNTVTRFDNRVCENGFPVEWRGHIFNGPGWQYDTLLASDGTDSVLAYFMQTWPTYDLTIRRTICNNQTTTFSGQTYNTPGTYRVESQSVHGCDSASTLELTVNAVTYGERHDTIVQNRLSDQHGSWYWGYYYCYEVHGQCFRDSISHHEIILRNAKGCDSILDFNIFVYWNRDTTLYDTICGDDLPYTWHDNTFTAANYAGNPRQGNAVKQINTYTTLKPGTSQRADSIIYLRLTVHPSYHFNENRVECENVMRYDYPWQDTVLEAGNTGGTYVLPRTSIYGCDSSYTLNLRVNTNSSSTVYDTIAEREVKKASGYRFNSATFRDTTTIIDSLILIPNLSGCDSSIHYYLFVYKDVYTTDDSTVCYSLIKPGWMWNNARFIPDSLPVEPEAGKSRSGVIVMTGMIPQLSTPADSFITMTVRVNPTYDHHIYDTICDDTAAFYRGVRFDRQGSQLFRINSMEMCDSSVTFHLNVYNTYDKTFYDTIYEDSIRYWGGRAYNEVGKHTYTDSLFSIHNCDSIMHLELVVNRKTKVDSSICLNHLPIVWNQKTFLTATTISAHLRTVDNELDSLVVMTVYTRDTSSTFDYQVHCDSFIWRNGHFFDSTSYSDTVKLTNQANCDSVIHLALTIYYSHPDTHYYENCNTFSWINGATYDSTVFGPQYMLRTTHDCDSLVTLDLVINYTTYEEWLDSICDGMGYTFRGIVAKTQGAYYDSLKTVKGCDSITVLFLTVLPSPTIELTRTTDCDNEMHTIKVNTDVNYIRWSAYPDDPDLVGHEYDSVILVSPKKNTTYSLYADYREELLCPTSSTITIRQIKHPQAVLKTSPDYFTYEDTRLHAIDISPVEYERRWYINGLLQPEDSAVLYYNIPFNIDTLRVKLELLSDYCIDSAVTIIPVMKPKLYVPNVFTPGEQSNNIFIAKGSEILDFEMYIYNRRGQLVFHSDDINHGWDGRYDGEICPQGAYVYRIHYRTSIIQKSWDNLTGTVLLLR